MEMFTDEIKRCLLAIAKKIEKEEEKPDYQKSERWQELRKQQDELYEKLKQNMGMGRWLFYLL